MTGLAAIVAASERVAATRSRRAKIADLAGCLRQLAPHEIDIGVAFLIGEIGGGRIGLGYAAVRDVRVAPADGPTLGLQTVQEAFAEIRTMSGAGSKGRRLRALHVLLSRATADEQRFLRRLVVGELRQGALEGIMADAVAAAADVPADRVRRAAMLRGDLPAVARAALLRGAAALSEFSLEIGRPLQPMLAQTAPGAAEAVERLGRAALEWKLDGARIQAHRRDDEIRVFSRRLNEVTAAVPEVVEAVRTLPATRLVLDGEAIALGADGRPQPFQVTMRRFGRKVDVGAARRTTPLTPIFFDCLHLDGDDLIDQPAVHRLQALVAALPEALTVPRLITADAEAAEAFLDEALRRGHEGLVAKSLEATYDAGRRGAGWLKIKPSHTLDLVVLAAEWGSGRRRGWLSNLHLGARDPERNTFVMLGKTFKGMTDEMLAWQTGALQQRELARDEWTVHVRPELVVEVAFDGVQESPQYPGGMALRFARVKRYRPDKSADQADTIERVREIFASGHAGR